MSVDKSKVLIQVQDLKKAFGSNQVLDGISTDICQGEVVAIIGPSGSGKSTFLRSLNLLEEPTGGKILFEGTDITDPKVDINRHRQKIGMVFQQFNLFPHKTVKQNIMMAPVALKLMTKEEASRRADELLARVGLPDKANAYPDMLSGGQKQRIAIARSLAMNPDVMLFDEPTSALDPEMVTEDKDGVYYQRVSLDDVLPGEEQLRRIEAIADPYAMQPQSIMEEQESRRELYDGLKRLTQREQTYLLYRYGFTDGEEHPLIGTAIYFHLTKGRAKKTEEQAMDNLWLELPWWFI